MIQRVASLDDPRLAPYRHVADAAWLGDRNLFVAEGRLVVARLLGLARYDVRSIVVTPAALEALGDRLSTTAGDVYVCERDVLVGVTGFNFHRGCLALAARPAPTPVDALMHAECVIGLEGVGNPDNVGGLFRVAAAFDAGGVVLDPSSGDPLYRKAIRTSMGAALNVPFVRTGDWLETLRRLRHHGFRIAALTPDAAATTIEPCGGSTTGERLALLVGAEGPGLTRETMALADVRLRIPISASVDSLNVVVAAGIALHALRRTRG